MIWKMNKMFQKFLPHLFLAVVFIAINAKFFYLNGFKTDNLLLSIYEIVIYFILFFFSIHLFRFSAFLSKIWINFLLLLSFVGVYFIDTMGIVIDKQIIKNTFATNAQETLELLGSGFFIYLSLAMVVLYLLNRFIISKLQSLRVVEYFGVFFLCIALFFGLSKIDEPFYKNFIKYDTKSIVPFNEITAFINYMRTKDREERIEKKKISSAFSYEQNSTTPLIVVMVIGESARGDRFSLNGYAKETNPLLQKEDNLLSFKDVLSCDTSTLSSLPCMVLHQKRGEFSFPISEESFVAVMRDHGFDTYWLTLQDEAPGIHTFCEEAQHCVQYDWRKVKYDTAMLERFKQIVQNAKRNTLIVLHMMGSHIEYNNRVPNDMKKFQPICKTQNDMCKKEELDNSYDNTIYFSDYFLDQLIQDLKDKNAFLLYSSDHGESLGEKQYGVFKRFGHASPLKVAPKAQTNVPFILWGSPSFMQKYKFKHPKKISHDNIFSTILGCSGFKSKMIDKDLDLCQKRD